MSADYFSPDYYAARARFRTALLQAGWGLESHPIPSLDHDGEPLTIDVGWIGDADATDVLVISSGLHGVEGFFGSAVQTALLEAHLQGFIPPPGTKILFLHALNPYGMAYRRRVNEDNVDLNRNFLPENDSFIGAPAKYAALNGLLNPVKPPNRFEPFTLLAGLQILRHGLPALKSAVAGGQYNYPEGLFYGGDKPSATQHMLQHHLPRLVNVASHVLHIDLHTGLGKPATHKLITHLEIDGDRAQRLQKIFGANQIEGWDPHAGVSYEIRGGFGAWCDSLLPNCQYDLITAEFGTTPVIQTLGALRTENQAHFHCAPDDPVLEQAKRTLVDTFAPPTIAWREQVIRDSITLFHVAISTYI